MTTRDRTSTPTTLSTEHGAHDPFDDDDFCPALIKPIAGPLSQERQMSTGEG